MTIPLFFKLRIYNLPIMVVLHTYIFSSQAPMCFLDNNIFMLNRPSSYSNFIETD